jgi:hypothetical protein
MAVTWTTEQVLALAPDRASALAGRELANAPRWSNLGDDARAAWGECQGSAAAPYHTQIDLGEPAEPAFHCTCPSRKRPCKHSLGLLLLHIESPQLFSTHTPPAWVAERLAKRAVESTAPPEPATPMTSAKSAAHKAHAATAAARRAERRQDRVAEGVQELDLWLRDLVRQGLAAAQAQPARYWEQVAAHMVDAQAPGLARRVRAMHSTLMAGDGWAERLAQQIGLLHLLLEGYRHIDAQPAEAQADIRAALGFTLKQEELVATADAQSCVRDQWALVGQRTIEEERLRTQRTWLYGLRSARMALLLAFAYTNATVAEIADNGLHLMAGSQLDAELVFYPSQLPLRAALKERLSDAQPLRQLPGYASIAEGFAAYAGALARNPWVEAFPAGIHNVIPLHTNERWWLRDSGGHQIPLSTAFTGGWSLQALSGGAAVDVFGEWDGAVFYPLSVWAEQRLVRWSV